MTGGDNVLVVRFETELVGEVRVDTLDHFTFAYSDSWLAREHAFPVSLTLPLDKRRYDSSTAHTFFANLLPEGSVRQSVCARLGISVDNDFALLAAIGGECAGALSLGAPDTRSVDPEDFKYEELSNKRLQSLIATDAVPLLIGGTASRLSLAGAQDKLPVAVLDGRLNLPLEAAPSTHILKLPNPRYPHLPANEAFVLGLAARVGFDVVEAELIGQTKPQSLLVKRYDRIASEDHWPVRRIHQEDLCQATGLPSTRKYEAEGGPSLVRVATAIRENVVSPLIDVRRLIQWQAFNVIVGNCDGHAKNLSLLYSDKGLRLAPFYDLVSTREFPSLDRKLAMAIGGRQDGDEIGRPQWEQLGRDLDIRASVVLDIVLAVASDTLEAMDGWTGDFTSAHGSVPIVQTLPKAIARRARRIIRLLAPTA